MTEEILKCENCSQYTLEKICSKCNGKCLSPRPAKYSPEDKYAVYRLAYKKKTNLFDK